MINRERLTNTFCELVSIDSPSGEEEEVSKYIESKLTELGFYGQQASKKIEKKD